MKFNGKMKKTSKHQLTVDFFTDLPSFDESKVYTFDIKERKNKRSSNQNKMFWELIGRIAKTQDKTDWEMYLDIMQNINIAPEYILALPQSEKSLKKVYRVVIPLDETREVKGKNLTIFKCQVGSSKLDKLQFAELLNYTIRLADSIGVNE